MKIKAWMRIAVSMGLLGWFLAGADLSQLGAHLAGIPAGEVLRILCLYTAAWLVNTVKWKTLLAGQSYFRLFALNMIGQFYALVLPGQIAGEVVKAWKLVARTGETAGAVTSILMDRLTGVMSLLGVGLIGASLTSTSAGRRWAVVFSLSVLVFALAALLMRSERCRTWSRSTLLAVRSRFPKTAGIADFLVRCIDAWVDYLWSPVRLLRAMAFGLVFQGLAVVILQRLSVSFGIQVALVDWCWIFAAVSLLLLLPITVGGIGLREGAFVTLLAGLGVSGEKALACSLALFGLHILAAAAGAVLDLVLIVRERSET